MNFVEREDKQQKRDSNWGLPERKWRRAAGEGASKNQALQ